MEVLLSNEQEKFPVDCDDLQRKILHILEQFDSQSRELSILLVDDAAIQELNRKFRKVDRPTDVLSFSQQEGESNPLNPHLLGDVVVSVETARRQASEHQLSLDEELTLLLIHGILHLLGFDHERSDEEAEEMKHRTRHLFHTVFPDTELADSCNY